MKSKWFVHVAWAVFALVLSVCVGLLVRQSPPEIHKSVVQLTEPRDGISEDLMIALDQAKNFHTQAKVYKSDGDLDKAIESVRQVLSLRFPVGAPEADDVRHDARAALATLLLDRADDADKTKPGDGPAAGGRGDADRDEAMRVVEEGLASVTRESFFVANLWTVKAEVHYARAEKMAGKYDPTDEKRAAIDALEKSIKINLRLQKQLESK